MNVILHKLTSVLMGVVVLISTMSFTVDMHYCGGTLVETVVFKKAKGCGMEMESSTIENCAITKKNCCSDDQIVIDGQDELQHSVDKISFEQQVFLFAFIQSYNYLFEGFDKELISYKDYKPPLVIRQIFKIDETYLI